MMSIPLAEKLRPSSLDEFVGQKHLLSSGKVLRNIIESKKIPNLIFYGPPGTGKTTLANIIAKQTSKTLKFLNCTTATTSDIKSVFEEVGTFSAPSGILLYLDEIQYLNKKQQQVLLEYTENGKITLIASTTENPSFYIYSAILSRSMVFEFKAIDKAEISKAVEHAFIFMSDELGKKIEVSKELVNRISAICKGDVRKALNIVEFASISARELDGKYIVTEDIIEQLTQSSMINYDKFGDEHYDILSAFQKSMRGSEPNAALHYLARLLYAGDLISACRRLMVCACEDVGLAYPQIIPIVKSAVDMAVQLGMPEARIPLADAVVLVSLSPKSNSAYKAIDKAIKDIENGNCGSIPRHLQNSHYDGDDVKNKGQFYRYPHEYEEHWVKQQYLPDVIKSTSYYEPCQNKTEQGFKKYWNKIKEK